MQPLEAKRTLVKSPPELWAEVSDAGALARHLGEFGEIRITRAQPESVVEWEGDLASGSVRLEPSGWGTRVTLTAEPAAVEPPPAARAGARTAATAGLLGTVVPPAPRRRSPSSRSRSRSPSGSPPSTTSGRPRR